MVVLGIDPGIARLGYGVVASAHGVDRCIAVGVVETPASDAVGPRLVVLRDRIRAIIAEYHPDLASVERLYFSKNVRTATVVGEARGVMLLTCAELGLPVVEVGPQEVKQVVVGYGSAAKQQVQRMVQVLLRLPTLPQPDDAADALAIALAGARCAPTLAWGGGRSEAM